MPEILNGHKKAIQYKTAISVKKKLKPDDLFQDFYK